MSAHTPGPSLKELAEAAERLPFDTSPTDVPFAARAAFCKAMPANVFLALLAALQEAVEDSEEVLATRITNFGENYRPWRLKSMRDQITKARAAIAKATEPT